MVVSGYIKSSDDLKNPKFTVGGLSIFIILSWVDFFSQLDFVARIRHSMMKHRRVDFFSCDYERIWSINRVEFDRIDWPREINPASCEQTWVKVEIDSLDSGWFRPCVFTAHPRSKKTRPVEKKRST